MGTDRGCGTWLVATVFCAIGVMSGAEAVARTGSDADVGSGLGSYLAARIAQGQNDTTAAARYYSRALERAPANRAIVHRAFLMAAAEGDFNRAVELAEMLGQGVKRRQLSNTWLGVAAFREARYQDAERAFRSSGGDAITRLASTLAQAWTKHAQSRQREAIALVSADSRAAWSEFFNAYQFYGTYHRALIADLAGNWELAETSFKAVIAKDGDHVRGVLAYARSLASEGRRERAIGVLEDYRRAVNGSMHPIAGDLLADISAGKQIKKLVSTPLEGLSEVFYGVGEALAVQDAQNPLGMLYLQLAIELKKPSPAALVALANLFERQERYARANAVYDLIPSGSSLFDAAQIRRALNMNSLDLVEDARNVLLEKAARRPDSIETYQTLANIMRSRKKFDEAVEYYTKAIDLVDKPGRQHWTLYYGRGASYERLKQWDNAEKDLLFAKKLHPNEPLILNYLGYSWVDQDRNLDEGLVLIKKAVALKPKDGYIVDSLGWAYYKLGDYERAVTHLEEAVRLMPEDPVLNDHLGDALWRVGRHREAKFQWGLALTFEPEPEEVDKIKGKLAQGLDGGSQVKRAMATTGSPGEVPASLR